MLTDARTLDASARIEVDVCVAGAGAAGITIARELAGSGLDVCLLEAGGEAPDADSRELYQGRCDAPLADAYLQGSRLRFLGGTTNHWLGYCRPFDADDFEAREWVPHSGWPIDARTLAPYYRRAAVTCGLTSELDPPAPVAPGTACRLLTTPFQVRATRFAAEYRATLENSSNLDLLLHATAVAIRLRADGDRVDRVEVATAAGRFSVHARRFVLALGGIENPRLLLVSDDVHRGGIGNRHDLVGRFFMDHPVFPVASVCVRGDGSPWVRSLHGSGADWYGFRLRPEEQQRRRILNCSLAFGLVPETGDTRRQLLRGGAWTRLAGVLEALDEPRASPRSSPRPKSPHLYGQSFAVRPEPAPNPESRVTLGDEIDRFGNRRVRLSWRLSELDFRTARESLEVLAQDAGRFGLGRVRRDPGYRLETAYSPGFHHMGTTRMHDDPREGVVDRHCRVHGVENLYVAGSSVFPTSSYVNPTFTLVALAVRLADHLKAAPR